MARRCATIFEPGHTAPGFTHEGCLWSRGRTWNAWNSANGKARLESSLGSFALRFLFQRVEPLFEAFHRVEKSIHALVRRGRLAGSPFTPAPGGRRGPFPWPDGFGAQTGLGGDQLLLGFQQFLLTFHLSGELLDLSLRL